MEQLRQLMYCGEGETGHYTFASSAAAAAKSLQSCPTLCNPIDGSPPGSPVPGILQARTLEWVAISFSNAWKWKVKVKSFSRARPFTTPWPAAHQAPPSMGFSASSTPLQMTAECLLLSYCASHSRIYQKTNLAGGKSLTASSRCSFLPLLIGP